MSSFDLNQITQPVLLVDVQRVKKNIEKVADKVNSLKISFRPHFKTHQSKYIGNIFREFGIKKISVSSFRMAKYFLQSNWRDILIAFPLNLRELDEILKISDLVNLTITISDLYTLEFLDRLLNKQMQIYLEFDVGFNRSGIAFEDFHLIEKVIKITKQSKYIKLVGIMSHNGLTYSAKSSEEVCQLNKVFLDKFSSVKKIFIENGLNPILSVGDTPSISICNDFSGVDELRPGNFVFFDVMQATIGSCFLEDIAVCAALPVVSINYSANHIVCYGGAVSLSKEYIDVDNKKIFGLVVPINDNGWSEPYEDTYVSKLYQDHCIISTNKTILNRYKPGDLIGVLPIHSCLTADAMKTYLVPGVGLIDHM